ncbi:hypothetical protein AAVH_18205 [Aphelenchoides avenae]|nr:hypothetical protein AAVH_18205 [Aphelenchus avenae]
MSSIQLVFLFIVASISLSSLAEASTRRQYCGKKLLRHMALVCRATECDANGQDVSSEASENALSLLAHECCTISCSTSMIESFCCGNPIKPAIAESPFRPQNEVKASADEQDLKDVLIF